MEFYVELKHEIKMEKLKQLEKENNKLTTKISFFSFFFVAVTLDLHQTNLEIKITLAKNFCFFSNNNKKTIK